MSNKLTRLDYALLALAAFVLLHLFPAGWRMYADSEMWRGVVAGWR